MKLTKSILREMIKDVLSEADIMDKEIKNPKTGNKIKVRTALQLPGEHPANKMAKKLVAKSPIKKDKTDIYVATEEELKALDNLDIINHKNLRYTNMATRLKYEDVRRMPDGKWGVYADKFVKGKRVMTPGGKHAKELKKVYSNEKDANDYMAAIMIAKGGG